MISTRENLKVELQQNLAYHEHRQQEEDALAELQQKQRELGGAAGADDIQAQVDDLNRKIEKARIEEAKTKATLSLTRTCSGSTTATRSYSRSPQSNS